MKTIYNIAMTLGGLMIQSVGRLWPGKSKTAAFIHGQHNLLNKIEKDCKSGDCPRGAVWIHCSSLGEYGVVAPIISQLHKLSIQVVVTFFSATGVRHFSDKLPQGVSKVYYLPLDTPRGARRFIASLRPSIAIFSVSEYWLNHLSKLKAHNIPTFLVSAKITGKEAFFKLWGAPYRRALNAYSGIFTIDNQSSQLLATVGYNHAQSIGNPLIDNALQKSADNFSDPIISAFCSNGKPVFVAGSIHTDNDLEMLASLVKENPDINFIVVPHEVDKATIAIINKALGNDCIVYSQCTPSVLPSSSNVLIIDRVGMLAHIYRFGTLAYIGGGFTKYLHSVVEAVAYGLPVAFGPRIERKITPSQLVEAGVATIVTDSNDLSSWCRNILSNPASLQSISQKAIAFMQQNAGATDKIVKIILSQTNTKAQ